MKEQTNSFGKRLDELIEKRGITRREFAAKIDITEVSLSRYISGEREPKASIVAKIAFCLNVSTDYLLEGYIKPLYVIIENPLIIDVYDTIPKALRLQIQTVVKEISKGIKPRPILDRELFGKLDEEQKNVVYYIFGVMAGSDKDSKRAAVVIDYVLNKDETTYAEIV